MKIVMTSDEVVAEYFSSLARAFSGRWSAQGRTTEGLPEVAEKALLDVELPGGLDGASVLRFAARCADLPEQQRHDRFGQPPLILYRADDFYIQALVWMEGSTEIHDHGFSGAFMVADGLSLHVKHGFEELGVVGDDRLRFGRLRSRSPEILRRGTVRRIDPGRRFIHALFHLAMPSISIVIRDWQTAGITQYRYREPGLASQKYWNDREFTRRMDSLDSLWRIDPRAWWSVCSDLARQLPCWEGFQLVQHIAEVNHYGQETQELVALFTQRYPILESLLPISLQTLDSQRKVLIRRGMLTDLHHRVFLALLANLPDPADTKAVIEQLFPGQEPIDVLIEWVEELTAPQLRSISGLSIRRERLSELRELPSDRGVRDLLQEVRAGWGDPLTHLVDELFR